MIAESNNWQRLAFEHLNRVVVFSEVARLGAFSAAAKALGLSRSTISGHITALEDALGIRLVERSTRSLTLTEAGREFLTATAPILRTWQEAREQLSTRLDTPRGTLTITAPAVLAEQLLLPVIELFIARYPQVEVDFRVSVVNLNLLEEGVDLAIRSGPLVDSSYGASLLLRDAHVLVGTPALAERWPIRTHRDLAGAPWIAFAPRAQTPTTVDEQGRVVPLRGQTRLRLNSAGVMVSAALAGCGFAVIPRSLIAEPLRTGALVHLLPEWSQPVTFYAVTASARRQSPRVKAFLALLREQLPPL